MAEAVLRDLLVAGVAARKVLIDPEGFTAWCELRDEKNNASARARFVSEKLRCPAGVLKLPAMVISFRPKSNAPGVRVVARKGCL